MCFLADTLQDTVVDLEVSDLLTEESNSRKKITAVITERGRRIPVKAVILTTGTFLGGKIFIGEYDAPHGRIGEIGAFGLTESLENDFKFYNIASINSQADDTLGYEGYKKQCLSFGNEFVDPDIETIDVNTIKGEVLNLNKASTVDPAMTKLDVLYASVIIKNALTKPLDEALGGILSDWIGIRKVAVLSTVLATISKLPSSFIVSIGINILKFSPIGNSVLSTLLRSVILIPLKVTLSQ